MNRRLYFLSLSIALLATAPARADVQVTFAAPEKYFDAIPRRDVAGAREMTIRTIREHLVRLGERYLAPNRTLMIEILDIDLAGELEWWQGPDYVRYLRSHTWPTIKLRYTLEESGQTIDSKEEIVSDPWYQLHVIPRSGESMPYEKEMLARWFRSRFSAGDTP